jgi:hypothetical protein
MGSMSASDAAPLPRLGEVYFDVRGESRSMRLSWYADTGVAVFSIWQGGTCTGTFRLPIADLPRMVQALQRGPDGDAGEEEQPAGQGRRGSPAAEPRPAPPDGDMAAAQGATVVQRPRSGRHHGDDRGAAGYVGGPAGELSEEPSTGYRDELDPGYPGDRSGSRNRDELTAEYGERPGSGRSGGYRDELGEQYSESRRASGHRAAPYEDEPTGVYRREDDPYADGEPGDRYGQEPTGPYRGDSLPGSHRDDGVTRAYRDDSLARGYPDDSLPGSHRDDSLRGSHRDDGLTRAYRDDSLPGGYHDDSLPGGHEQEPGRQYPGDRSRGYERDGTAAYPRGRYDEEPTGVYRGDLLHEDDRGGRYAEREYPGDPLAADYPTGPSALDYPGAGDARDYPASSQDPGYSPVRPYVTPRSREAGLPEEAGAREPRRSRSRPDDEAIADSFPYGESPSERPARGRAR